jgi:hypothetical protein
LVEATEPTNIIWENRHFTTKDYVYRTFVAFSFICFLLCVSFAIIFYSKIYAIVIDSKYPDVDCDYITEVYGNSTLEKWAYLEYVAYYNASEGEEALPFSGTLQCFCDDLTDTLGYGTDLFNYKSTGLDSSNEAVKLCYDYIYDTWISLGISNAVSYLIVGINYALRIFIIMIIIYIGKDTESE